MIIDLVNGVLGACSLDDVDILTTDSLLDLTATLADRELGENAVTLRDAQKVADVVDKLWVGVASKHHQVSNHLDYGGVWCLEMRLRLKNACRRELTETVASVISAVGFRKLTGSSCYLQHSAM